LNVVYILIFIVNLFFKIVQIKYFCEILKMNLKFKNSKSILKSNSSLIERFFKIPQANFISFRRSHITLIPEKHFNYILDLNKNSKTKLFKLTRNFFSDKKGEGNEKKSEEEEKKDENESKSSDDKPKQDQDKKENNNKNEDDKSN